MGIGKNDYFCGVLQKSQIMKRYLFTAACLLLTLCTWARGVNENDPKYGKGAVPVNENGSVCFTKSMEVPQGMSDAECYNILFNWAKGRFAMPYAQAGRILSENADRMRFVFHVDQTLVFKRTAIVADESKIAYNFSIAVKDGKYSMTMTDISYSYEEGREGGGRNFTAEEWITDREAYNRKGNHMLKSTAKFRIKTIDLKDILFERANDAVKANTKE